MLELNEVREQLRIDEDDTSDVLLNRYVGAAVRKFESRTLRSLYKSAKEMPNPAPSNAVILDDDIALALMLLVGHWNANREATTDVALVAIPHGFNDLAEPYRWWPE